MGEMQRDVERWGTGIFLKDGDSSNMEKGHFSIFAF